MSSLPGYMSSAYRYDCQSSGCYMTSLPSWERFNECFMRGIQPTDVDGLVEINGHFLFLEEKGAGVPMTQGQRQALRRLADLPSVTVIVFRPLGDDLEVMVMPDPAVWQPFTTDAFYELISTWALVADSAPRPADSARSGAA
jgi:hypothetical protein